MQDLKRLFIIKGSRIKNISFIYDYLPSGLPQRLRFGVHDDDDHYHPGIIGVFFFKIHSVVLIILVTAGLMKKEVGIMAANIIHLFGTLEYLIG